VSKSSSRRHPSTVDTRSALLDAAEELLLKDGYAAVTSRRVADRAGANSGLVYYYFESMEGLLVELFRRNAERGLERQAHALQAPQPLWALWDDLTGNLNDARTVEYFALARHHKAVRTEVAKFSRKYRRLQFGVLTDVLRTYDLDLETWPASALILTMASVSLLLLVEKGYGFSDGHDELVRVIERQIRELEGERWSEHPAVARQKS
jgi:AcrR family transcriptional regulator